MEKEKTYKVICISLYHEDVDRLTRVVAYRRHMGEKSASKSSVLRAALAAYEQCTLEKVIGG